MAQPTMCGAFKTIVKIFEGIIILGHIFIIIEVVKLVFAHSKPFFHGFIKDRVSTTSGLYKTIKKPW
ncbi:MAG: hypothetical protein ACTSQP_08135 [Promethearchaeota archaeon]